MEHIIKIAEYMLGSLIHMWPYLLVTIPVTVAINLAGLSVYITRAFSRNPWISVFLATVIGAFSPFCSCGVIPVIASLLMGGVPLAPVMSFWIASPSMDPEIFFLSVSILGLKMAVWRLSATFLISLSAGYITHILFRSGCLGSDFLRSPGESLVPASFREKIYNLISMVLPSGRLQLQSDQLCCEAVTGYSPGKMLKLATRTVKEITSADDVVIETCGTTECSQNSPCCKISGPRKVINEIIKATWMVLKFMLLAFFLTALIEFYVPREWITKLLAGNSRFTVLMATLIGIPVYTSNLTALPLTGGLIDLGMNKGAALAFLISGATTTLPAMTAVWGITKPRVFVMYMFYIFAGSLLTGIIFNLLN